MSMTGRLIGNVPLLIIPFALYNVVAFTSEDVTETFSSQATDFLSMGNLIIFMGIALLFIEIYKATRTGQSSIMDHTLSMLLFIGALVEFIMISQAMTSPFLTLLMIMLVDVVGGFTITIRGARRDFGAGGGGIPMS
jgi:hypothetical protein